MKKVLILAYDFPPYVSVGGLRPYNWYKYLKEYGVEPVVVTRQWGNKYGNLLDYIAPGTSNDVLIEQTEYGTIVRTPYKPNLANRIMLKYGDNKFVLLRRMITAWYEILQYFLPVGPKASVYKGARNYLKANQVDAIVATGDPFVLFSYASKLSREFTVPWIADYRDPWSHSTEHQLTWLQRKLSPFLEKKNVKTAAYITTVSEFVRKKIAQLVPDVPFAILPNGYDPEVIEAIREIPQGKERLQLAFVGTIYDWHPYISFLNQFNNFIESHPEAFMTVNFYGTNRQEELQELIARDFPLLQKHVGVFPKMPNRVLLETIARENVMLLFNYYSFMGTKIFDYVGLKRKIILCYGNDSDALQLKKTYYNIEETGSESDCLQAELLEETNAGIVVRDAAHLTTVFESLYNEFQETGQIACDSRNTEQYSRKIQVKQLAEIIQTCSRS